MNSYSLEYKHIKVVVGPKVFDDKRYLLEEIDDEMFKVTDFDSLGNFHKSKIIKFFLATEGEPFKVKAIEKQKDIDVASIHFSPRDLFDELDKFSEFIADRHDFKISSDDIYIYLGRRLSGKDNK